MIKDTSSVFFISGFGMSGSSVVSDILKEISSSYVMKSEFRLFTDPDGLISLESALTDNWNFFQADTAIKRFLKLAYALSHEKSKNKGAYGFLSHQKDFGIDFYKGALKFVDNLVEGVYQGLWTGIYTPARRKPIMDFKNRWNQVLNDKDELRRVINSSDILEDRAVCGDMYIANPLIESEFLELVHEFLGSLIYGVLKKEGKHAFVFDEGYAAMNPEKVMRYIPAKNKKMAVVLRNPLDVFVNIQISRRLFVPEEVDMFIKWQKAIFKRWERLSYDENDLLFLRFEDVVLAYENNLAKIFDFFGVNKALHVNKKTIFNPDKSKKKINLYKEYLEIETLEKLKEGLNSILIKYGYC